MANEKLDSSFHHHISKTESPDHNTSCLLLSDSIHSIIPSTVQSGMAGTFDVQGKRISIAPRWPRTAVTWIGFRPFYDNKNIQNLSQMAMNTTDINLREAIYKHFSLEL